MMNSRASVVPALLAAWMLVAPPAFAAPVDSTAPLPADAQPGDAQPVPAASPGSSPAPSPEPSPEPALAPEPEPALTPEPAVERATPVPPPRAAPPPEQEGPPPGKRMAVAGSVLIFGSIAGYVAMAVGLGISTKADADVKALSSVGDVERRREVMARGQLGNRLALGAGISAVALMGTGIALVVLGRRRADEARAAAAFVPAPGGGAFALRARF